ncbi:hypothetical protein [Roseomonas populi]|uniref:Transmembrane protein n=1 Tax=Roseomonas populi TaxID=3121582 RepID=A0ABT1X477_9PROT|nr:hypothetical protein [Roseomonas pecuniae]MCR0982904.1 hypothetical protein [Roseomonas pecuniae]
MIIWRGWGILTVVILALVGGGATLAAGKLLESYGANVGYGFVLGLVAAATANWIVGNRLNGRPVRELVDAQTGERVVLRTSHSLFFIPMQWWSVLMILAAVVALSAILFGHDSGVKPQPWTGMK